nr:reverse transcriptase domain, reverse transcriptase zinc-binding domain protein [Tanacetum cinerariifolium]
MSGIYPLRRRFESCILPNWMSLGGEPGHFSIGDRLTLIKSVLDSIPIYYLSFFKAPLKIINLLESLRARFFWGFKDGARGISRVKWNSIILNHKMGGLSVGSIHAKNFGLLGKWKRRTWCEILKAVDNIKKIDPSFEVPSALKSPMVQMICFGKILGLMEVLGSKTFIQALVPTISGTPGFHAKSIFVFGVLRSIGYILDDRSKVLNEDIFPFIQRISKAWISARCKVPSASWSCWIPKTGSLLSCNKVCSGFVVFGSLNG